MKELRTKKELTHFADVHLVLKDPPTMGEYRYGEKFEGDFPKTKKNSTGFRPQMSLYSSKRRLISPF